LATKNTKVRRLIGRPDQSCFVLLVAKKTDLISS